MEEFKAATLLYISDDQFSLASVKVQLESRGYRVLLARTCTYAWHLLNSRIFDAVVFDADMGDQAAQEMTSAIKASACETRILLFASHCSQACPASCDAVCTKLDGFTALLTQLTSLLSSSPKDQSTPAPTTKRHSLRHAFELILSPKRQLKAS